MGLKDIINPISWFTKGVEVVGNTVVKVKKTWSGSKSEQDGYENTKFLAGLQAHSAEFTPRKNSTWWDSFWDGINRMPRPLIVISIFWYFAFSYYNPIEFQVLNIALQTVPEEMWWIMSAIVSFYFVAREFSKSRQTKLALSDVEFNNMQKRITTLRSKADELPPKEVGYVNPSIEEWKEQKDKEKSN